MRCRWAARLLVLALVVGVSDSLGAQGQSSRDVVTGSELRQNQPNPFESETSISFTVGGYPNCADPGRQYRVSLRIYNVLAQLVAVPVFQGGVGGEAPGRPVENVFLTCGEYTARWDGKVMRTGREASSGIYSYRLEIDGRALTRKMTLRR
ncbi:MAG TPA: hypothetical protein VNL96_08035 [Gemmatimonadaceae bacterium]|nr:hypothetical protein [Gemmatimonadaceae bacterium]